MQVLRFTFRTFIKSDSIDLFEPEGFIPSNMKPPNVTFKSRKAHQKNKTAVEIYKNAHKWTAAGSLQNAVTNNSMTLTNNFNLFDRLSMGLDDGKGPWRVSSRLDDELPKDHSQVSKRDWKSKEIGNEKLIPTIHNILHFLNKGFVEIIVNGLCQEVMEKLDYSKNWIAP